MRSVRTVVRGAGAALTVAAALSCGGGSSAPPTSSSSVCTPSTSPTTFVIMNNTVCPQSITVARGTQVTFSNQDSIIHDMNSDPHPEHTDCPEINQVGFLNPGQSRLSGNLNVARRCGFHDHSRPENASTKGTIVIQ
jgi:plastocyanin